MRHKFCCTYINSVQQLSIEHGDMFEEIPLTIKTSKLGSVLLCELEGRSNDVQSFDFLSLSTRLVGGEEY